MRELHLVSIFGQQTGLSGVLAGPRQTAGNHPATLHKLLSIFSLASGHCFPEGFRVRVQQGLLLGTQGKKVYSTGI